MPNFFINVKEKGAKKASGNIGALTGSMKRMVASAAVAAVAMETMRKAIVRSAEVEGVKRGFDNLAKSTGFSTSAFDKFKDATDGTIDNLTLMKQANSAMLLGITDSEDQMAQMFDVAQRLGQSLGIDTVQSIESLVTGLGRQSKLMLDNLGIMIDGNKANEDYAESIGKTVAQLTDQERKTAFINAAMKEANTLVSQLGDEQMTTKDKIAQMNTALLESLTAFGNLLTPLVIPFAEALGFVATEAAKLMDVVTGVNNEFTGTASTLQGFNVWLKENKDNTEALALKTAELNKEEKELKEELAGLTSTGKSAIDFNKDFAMSIDMASNSSSELGEGISIVSDDYAEFTRQLFEAGMSLDEFLLQQQESTLATTTDNTARAQAIEFILDEIKRKRELIRVSKLGAEIEKATTMQTLNATAKLMEASAKGFEQFKGAQLVAARLNQVASVINTYTAINKTLADPNLKFPANVITAAAIGATGFANVMQISKSIGEFRTAATGMDEVVNKPTLILAGEAGAESVNITPLTGDTASNTSAGSTINVTVQGNVMSDEFTEQQVIPAIQRALKNGESLEQSRY